LLERDILGRFGIRHCEERSDEAIQPRAGGPGLLRFARNDEEGALKQKRPAVICDGRPLITQRNAY
jgi:hypothetical protein